MGTWSIIGKTPSTAPDASIGSSDGRASFPANTSTTTDNKYIIQYDNGNGCTETTTYTVKKCIPEKLIIDPSLNFTGRISSCYINSLIINGTLYKNNSVVTRWTYDAATNKSCSQKVTEVSRTISKSSYEDSNPASLSSYKVVFECATARGWKMSNCGLAENISSYAWSNGSTSATATYSLETLGTQGWNITLTVIVNMM